MSARSQGFTRIAAAAVAATAVALGGGAANAAYPGANGKIAFSDWPSLGVVDPNGANPTLLTPTAGWKTESSASYSADGSKLAFMRVEYSAAGDLLGTSGIYVADAAAGTTTDAMKVPSSETLELNGQKLSLSPDGTKVAIASGGIVAVTVATGSQLRLTTDDPNDGLDADRDPAWSPDGTRIAFSRQIEVGGSPEVAGDRRWYIHVSDAAGRNTVSLASPTAVDGTCERYPSWSPDGTKIAYTASTAWCEDALAAPVAVMNADGSGRAALAGASGKPVWSPDGGTIAFTPGGGGVFAVPAGGGTATAIRATGEVEDWQPIPVAVPPPPLPDPEPACTWTGTEGNDVTLGTRENDVLCGLGGNDVLNGWSGDDVLRGGKGNDLMSGGAGNDRIQAADGSTDLVFCGPGFDTVTADRIDIVLAGCEDVRR